MENNNGNGTDIIEFMKEITQGKDMSEINFAELVGEQDRIREVLSEQRDKELSEEELEAIDTLENILDIGSEEVADLSQGTIANNLEMSDVIEADLQDTVEGLPIGEFSNENSNKLIDEIRGCNSKEYARKCDLAEKEWTESKKGKTRSATMERGR